MRFKITEDAKRNRALAKRIAKKFEITVLQVAFEARQSGTEMALGRVCFAVCDKMTLGGLHDLCDGIAEYCNGFLYGLVDVDFSGTVTTVEMLVEEG